METGKTVVELRYRESLLRDGIAVTLASHADFVLQSGAAGLPVPSDDWGPGRRVDVIVADYEAAIDAVTALRSRRGHSPRVLVVTERNTETEIRWSLRCGVHGYLLTDCSQDELVDGVIGVARGQRPMSELVVHRLAESLLHPALTAREHEVLQLMARGFPNKAIAARLDIAVGTVKSFTRCILAKLAAASRTEAVALAERRGLLRPVSPIGGKPSPQQGADACGDSGSFWSADRQAA